MEKEINRGRGGGGGGHCGLFFLNGVRRYLLMRIDVGTRFGFAYGYSHLSSRVAKDFMKKFRSVAPFEVRGLKTDNGSEFLGEFEAYLRDEGIEHYFNYPRYPKGNAYVERFNRSLQEDFVDYREEELRDDLEGFNRELIGYLPWYNTERALSGLSGRAPLEHFCKKFLKNPVKSNII